MQGQKDAPAEGCAELLGWIAQLVDDMAALLSASALQLLGGCRGAAVAWEALQASRGCAVTVSCSSCSELRSSSCPKCRQAARRPQSVMRSSHLA